MRFVRVASSRMGRLSGAFVTESSAKWVSVRILIGQILTDKRYCPFSLGIHKFRRDAAV
jgi:hypothetical protein